jgi:hypothetical protein
MMRKIGWMVAGGVIVLAVQATSVADERSLRDYDRALALAGDCGKGTIEARLDCLSFEVGQLKRRLDGNDGRVLQLGR